jgi:hypothetical protein
LPPLARGILIGEISRSFERRDRRRKRNAKDHD